jgi:tripartite-type tricarboxylate transporter receptor subunit TctC
VWWGIIGPSGIPPPIVNKLNAEINAILRDPQTTKRLESEAAEAVIATPEMFGGMVASEVAKWTKVAAAAGIRSH